MQWYYVSGGVQQGPVDEAELRRLARSGGLQPSDYVWNESLGERWARAAEVEGLFPPAAEPPPPVPPPPAAAFWERPGSEISCTAPVGAAWEGMKAILFRPFDLGKWFLLGVSAWLATLGEGGGSFNFPNLAERGEGVEEEFGKVLGQAATWIKLHLALVGGLIAALLLLGLALGLVVMWLRCRGKFMFLDNVVRDRTEIGAPWREFAREGNSLFKWTLVYLLVCLLIVLALIVATVLGIVVPCVAGRGWRAGTLAAVAVLGVLWLGFGVAAAYVGRFLEDFIVPAMYRSRCTATEAWRSFRPVLAAHFGRLALYGLFYLVLTLAAGVALLLVALATCCIAGCLMLLPYVGAVVLLPVTVFFRLYSLEYAAQFGPAFDVRLQP